VDFPIETGLASTALALLILREVFGFLKDRKINGNGHKLHEVEKFTELEKELEHLNENLRKLTHTINNQTQTMNAVLFKIQHDVSETRQQIKEAVTDCRRTNA
jgi:peptidoglycan hydrolase CwlO-like protein